MNRRTRTGLGRFAAPLIVIGLLSGCAGPSSGLDGATGQELQSRVVGVANAAAAGDTAGAIEALDALEARLAEAESSGSVSTDRASAIRAAIATVRADLTPAVETPAPTVEPSAPPEPATPVEDEDDDSGDDGNGNNGNGNGNGNNNNGNNGNGKKDK